jgi:hypothetical protein
MYLGWDWASQRHDLTVIDDTGQLVDRWTLARGEAISVSQSLSMAPISAWPSSSARRPRRHRAAGTDLDGLARHPRSQVPASR